MVISLEREVFMQKKFSIFESQQGQGLVEYLIIVALIGVATIAVMKVVGQNVKAQFARVALAIEGRNTKVEYSEVRESQYRERDMSDFFRGSSKRDHGGDND
jgi:Flp pilus assembly pilin Flp